MIKGIDVSYAQGKPNWSIVKSTGEVDFVYVKASEGVATKGPDSSFQYNWKLLKELGIPRGAYHFYRANHDPVKQAEIFFSIVGELSSEDLPPVIDIEVPPVNGQNNSQYAENVKKFIEKAEELFKRRLVVYTGGPIFNSSTRGAPEEILNFISDRDLWLSAYVVSPNKFVPNAWASRKKSWTIWQKSGDIGANNTPGKRIKGINNVVDYNEFDEKILSLSDWIKSSYVTPVKSPVETVPLVEEDPNDRPTDPDITTETYPIDVVVEQPTPAPDKPTKNWINIILDYIKLIFSMFLRSTK